MRINGVSVASGGEKKKVAEQKDSGARGSTEKGEEVKYE